MLHWMTIKQPGKIWLSLLFTLNFVIVSHTNPAEANQQEIHPTVKQKEIRIVGWDVYADPENSTKTIGYRGFEQKHNVRIHYTPLSNLDDIISAVESNEDYDVIIISNEGIRTLQQMKLVQALETSQLSQSKNLYPQFKNNRWIKVNNQLYAVPWAWGPTGLLYNQDVVDQPESWNILWDPQYKNQVSLWDDVSMIWTAALALGYTNVYNLTREQLDKVKQKLFELNNQTSFYYRGEEDALRGIRQQQIHLLNSWFDPSARLKSEGINYNMTIPKEGAVGMFDSYMLRKNTANTALAYQYINYQLTPRVQSQMVRITGLSPANKNTVLELTNAEIKALHLDDKNYYGRMLLWDVMPRKQLYEQVLQEVHDDARKKSDLNSLLPFTSKELQWIIKNPVVKFTGDPNWLPYEAFTKDGEYIGIVAEHLKLISKSTGLKFETIPTKTWTESTIKAREKAVDVLSETDDSDLKSHLNFTNPYISNPIVITMLSDSNFVEKLSDIKNKRLALIKDYGYASKIRRKYQEIDFHTVDDIQSGLIAVSTGEVDALLCTLALCSYTIAELGLNNVKVVGKTEFDTKLAFGVQKDLTILNGILNKALANISREQQQVILDKWIKEKFTEKTDYTLVIQVTIAAIIVLAIFAFWNRSLSHEINLRIKSEKETEKSQARFEAMFESIPDAIIYADPDRKIRLVNQAAINMFGYPEDELTNHQTRILYASTEDFEAQGKARYNPDSTTDASKSPYVVKYKTKSGHEFDGETLGTAVKSTDGDTIGFLGIVRDISERSHVEAILRSLAAGSSSLEFNQFLETTLECMAELYNCKYAFIGLLNESCATVRTLAVRVDNQIADNFEYSLDGTPCKDIMDLTKEIIPDHAAELYPDDELLAQMNVESYFGAPLLSSENKVIGILSVMDTKPLDLDVWTEPVLGVFATRVALELEKNRAIQALKDHREQLEIQVKARTVDLSKARDEAEKANASKSEFLSRMSHELRTPMNAILGFGQILEHNAKNTLSDSDLSYVQEVLKGGYHLLDLINEVLDLSRVESGELQLTNTDFNLPALIEEIISLIDPLAEQSNITIEHRRSDDNILIHADRMRIKQVVLNLISNAVKYNNLNGSITLSYEINKDTVHFNVSDTGPGIPAALQQRVFEPFDRLDANTTEIEGTGIGLSLSKKMIELMGGKIGFESTKGKGSTFWIEMQAATRQADDIDESNVDSFDYPTTTGEFTLLYVEDNPANLRLVTQLLKTQDNINLYDAHTATLAIDLINSHQFDLILLDIHLPGEGDGFDVLKKLRSNSLTKDIPVIAISANATDYDIEHGLSAGFDDYITKPIKINKFMKTINRYLKNKTG